METITESTDEEGKGVRRASKDGIPADSDDRRYAKFLQELTNIHTRTPMGDYIVPEGGNPLTHQAIPGPGPADYMPSNRLTSRNFPHYSIVGRSKNGATKPAPGPADYDTSGALIWRDKKVTLKGKGATMITEEADDSRNTIGPAQYNVQYFNTGKHAPKISVSSRHRDSVSVGHQSNALSGIGFPTPGPNAYSPKLADKGRHKSFGVLHRHGRACHDTNLGPGPAAYHVTDPPTKSGYSLAKRLKAEWQCVSKAPAPNSYNVGSKIGKGLAMSLRSRQPYEHKTFGPSPNSYFLRDAIKNSDAPCALITYRPFESEDTLSPGPTHYTLNNKTLRKAPTFSFRGICKYPKPEPKDTPGPGTYQRPRVFTENDAPAYSMGRRTKPLSEAPTDGPGPNHYNIRVRHRPDGKKAPSFTMAARCIKRDRRMGNPAPTAYTPKIGMNEGPKYSMTARNKIKPKSGIPSPNSYTITTNQTVKGRFTGQAATLKGRNTRFLYQGYAFENSVRLLPS